MDRHLIREGQLLCETVRRVWVNPLNYKETVVNFPTIPRGFEGRGGN